MRQEHGKSHSAVRDSFEHVDEGTLHDTDCIDGRPLLLRGRWSVGRWSLVMIKAIIFDFGGVFDQQHEALGGFQDAAQRYNIAPQAFYDLLYSGDAWQQAKIGAMTGHDYWHQYDGRAGTRFRLMT